MSWEVPGAITVHGTGGSLAVGYQIAAELGAWTVTTWPTGEETRRCRVEAQVLMVDPFWIKEASEFALTLSRGRWTWRWPAVPAPTNGTVVADGLPPPERR